ncbi:hypothetical protein [Burkholderia stabilis]|uniref:hypothetical protein n=1 Tax=Burkholderia stabilis TaxID=95485 RepID=UPI00158D1413|nr:hypothetical protein [Burkholderia stabilis]
MRSISEKRKILYRKFLIGYLCLLGVPLMILALSIRKGAGWAGLVPGIPIYLTLLSTATYQFIKELRALKRESEDGSSNREDH